MTSLRFMLAKSRSRAARIDLYQGGSGKLPG
jgi:hypothetical protein